MKLSQRQTIIVTAIVVLAVVLDQCLKLYIHRHFMLGESVSVLPFFELCYVENDGMAFGIEWFDKIFLTIFRLAAVCLLGWYMHYLIHPKEGTSSVRTTYLAMVAMIMAGALGNIIDCLFYGKLFGYATWCYGRVIDMLYFPLITDAAGNCIFFRPVFNIADSCITVAVIAILIWFRKDLDRSLSHSSDDKKSNE